MKILVFAPYAINTPHFETELEIIQHHLDAEDNVSILVCNAELLACDVNLKHDVSLCINCIAKRFNGMSLLSKQIDIKHLYFLNHQNQEELKSLLTNFSNLKELKKLKIENFDIGYAVLSSLISATRDPEPDLDKYSHVLENYLISSLGLYRTIQNYLDSEKFDRVYVYNGRYAPMRAVLRACQSKNVECLVHEKGSRLYKYSLFKNTMPHDLDYVKFSIQQAWFSGENSINKKKIAEQFFIDRAKGICRTWISFTKEQEEGLLPGNWDSHKNNIVIFVSSEDEFAAIGDYWSNPIYDDQLDGIQKILNSFQENTKIHIYIRIHPNLKKVKNRQTEQLNSLESSNLTIIPADSPISSYTLIKKASKVLTFGSTIGIEAAYWGQPSILAGQCFYRELGSTYNPRNHQELIHMLSENLTPKNKEGALMYAYYLNTYGTCFKYYQAKGIYKGYFKGVMVKTPLLIKITSKLLRSRFFGWLNRLIHKISVIQVKKNLGINITK